MAKDDVPISDMTLVERAAVLFDKEQDLSVEHWSNPYAEAEANRKYARIIRWTLIQEERLKISTNSGTLYFRFYSDLAYFEAENSGEPSKNSHAIERDIAFQWTETISRICGRSRLHQNLPHFGEGNEAELRDYLEVVHFHEKEAENAKKKVRHKRIRSMIELSRLEMDGSVKKVSLQNDAVSTLKVHHRPVKSMTEVLDITQSQQNRQHRKNVSFGNKLNSADNQV